MSDQVVHLPRVGEQHHGQPRMAVNDDAPSRATAGSSWRPVDLAPIIAGSSPRPTPTILRRTDGQGLWYPGKTHAVVGESESLKSWLAQAACAQLLLDGLCVVYVDFEDSADAVVDRMRILGASDDALRERFAYIAPEEPLLPGQGVLAEALGDIRPAAAVLDGTTEAMALHKLSSIDNDDLATFGRLVTRPIAATGAAVVNLDHQPKSTDNRGRYALGGVHKLNGLSGVSLIAEGVEPAGVGLRGVSRLRIAKDRPGQLRAHGLPSAGGLRWVGDFVLDTRDPVDPAFIRPPAEAAKAADDWRPTEVMRKISAALTKADQPLTQTGIEARVTARATITRRALAVLIDEGHINVSDGPRNSKLHSLTKPYDSDPT